MRKPIDLQEALERLPLYIMGTDYRSAAAFVAGFNLASGGSALQGFHAWLVVRVGCGDNLGNEELVLWLAFPGCESPRERLCADGGEEQAIKCLIKSLNDFWRDRSDSNGMRRIYCSYENWLAQQSWYTPTWPDWIDRTGQKDAIPKSQQ
jgi:hypothetical protein